MKMARASEKDLEAALAVSRIIEELEKGYMPGQDDEDGIEFFDRNDPEQCRRALEILLGAAEHGSIFRVTFGMAVVLDPRNRLLDTDADTLEVHPDHEANAQDAARWRFVRKKLCLTGNGDGTCAMQAINLPATITGWPEPDGIEAFCDAAIDAARAQRAEGNGDGR